MKPISAHWVLLSHIISKLGLVIAFSLSLVV